ncbi:MAG: undecaprenyldiphospho-muramoylpentapeptide beta-N-acetylglucosaminyltransferase [Bryobacterales bacterium]|nr:undecaprenyldiphospho-muramoylpentapeptide beta-N-acetylglucosaminyltransferase [Bryobacterales bacterium]
MKEALSFLMAGGGTGGHVLPLVAVAREVRRRGHRPWFIGTRQGLEARLVPPEGFDLEFIEIGALNRVGVGRAVRTLGQLPGAVARVLSLLGNRRPAAVFSLGGYAAGPVVLAAAMRRVPVALMEPNAVAGMTNRWMSRFAARSLVSFPQAARWFPADKTELAGLPVREEFYAIPPKPRGGILTLLVTGGSQGSRRLNQAGRESWPLFKASGMKIRVIHQSGPREHAEMASRFAAGGLEGEVVPFIQDMPAAFAGADLIVSRSGAGAVSELAAAGKPSILVPFPFAADEHQLRNAEALAGAGAARVLADAEADGERLFAEVTALSSQAGLLEKMGGAARSLARPGAAAKVAGVLEELAARAGFH